MKNAHLISRRDAAILCAGALAPNFAWAQTAEKKLLARAIPHGAGETLPAVGVGTVTVFDVGPSPEERAGPLAVVNALVEHGGTLIDTSPDYGHSEAVIGDILAATGLRPRVFISTKSNRFRKGGLAPEAQQSLARLKIEKLDVLQLHNITDPNQDMGELEGLKAQGVCRYTGITTTFQTSYDAAEAIIRRTKPDFLEIDYAIDNRVAEERVLPAAADAGTAVLAALPFGRGRLFQTALGKQLPDWAAEFDCASWAQFFLKYILGNPALTAAIPGTDKATHMIDNLAGARGRLPDKAMRARMVRYIESL